MAIQLKIEARTLREVDPEVPEGHHWFRLGEVPDEVIITAESVPVEVARVGVGGTHASGALSLGAVRWSVTDEQGSTIGAVDPADPFRYRVPRPSGPAQIIVQCQEVPARAGGRRPAAKPDARATTQKASLEPPKEATDPGDKQPVQQRQRLRRARRLPPAVVVTVWILRGTISKRISGARHAANAGGLRAAQSMGWRDSVELGIQFEPVEGPIGGIPEGERGLSYGGHIELQGQVEPTAIAMTGCRFHFVRWKYQAEAYVGHERFPDADGDDTSYEATLVQRPTEEGLVFDTDAPGDTLPDRALRAGVEFGLKARFRELLAIGPRAGAQGAGSESHGAGAWQQVEAERRQLTEAVEWYVELAFQVQAAPYVDASGRYHNAIIRPTSRPSLA